MDPTAPPVPSLSLEEPQGGTELALQHPSVAAAANVTAAAVMAEAGSSLQGVEAEVVLLPLRLAIESRQSRMMETALDCLHVRGGERGTTGEGLGERGWAVCGGGGRGCCFLGGQTARCMSCLRLSVSGQVSASHCCVMPADGVACISPA